MRTLLVGFGARGKSGPLVTRRTDDHNDRICGCRRVESRVDARQHQIDAGACVANLRRALVATQPGLVVPATPPAGRFEQIMSVFQAGAHLLSERALSLDFAEDVRYGSRGARTRGWRSLSGSTSAISTASSPPGPSSPAGRSAPSSLGVRLLAKSGRVSAGPESVPLHHASADAVRADDTPCGPNAIRLRARGRAPVEPRPQSALEHVSG